uniref:Uncharacterized protein n=1 Tax=Anguilla anguilla TaxID=7936 RepID=A0A0E9UZD8_ANGAN
MFSFNLECCKISALL